MGLYGAAPAGKHDRRAWMRRVLGHLQAMDMTMADLGHACGISYQRSQVLVHDADDALVAEGTAQLATVSVP